MLFSFSLKDRAKMWLNSLALGKITTWEELAKNVLAKYFPREKTTNLINDITTFTQWDNEFLYESWVHFKDTLNKYPHHDLYIWLQIKTFYNGLGTTNRSMIYITVGRALMGKIPEVALGLLIELASNKYQWSSERARPKYVVKVMELDQMSNFASQLVTINKKLDRISVNL